LGLDAREGTLIRPSRIRLAGILLSLLLAGALLLPQAAKPQATSPNVLFILLDDAVSGTEDRMPFVDSQTWYRFTNAIAENPLCCPSRSTILSGLYDTHTGVNDNTQGSRFDPSDTFATRLHDAGYETGMFGKYLNRYPFGDPTYEPPGWDRFVAFAEGNASYYNYTLDIDGATLETYGSEPEDYSTNVLSAKLRDFLATAQPPFLAYFTPFAPHARVKPAPGDDGTFDGQPVAHDPSFNQVTANAPAWWAARSPLKEKRANKKTNNQYEADLAVDRAVEAAFSELDSRGLLDSTLVILMSDNALALGDHRWGAKECPYEKCLRVPLLIHEPEQTESGTVQSPAINADLNPTILDEAGVPAGQVDGRSLVPAMHGSGWSDRELLIHLATAGANRPPGLYGIRTAGWKYTELDTGEKELYDLTNDPWELQNLDGDSAYAAQELQLAAELAALKGSPSGPQSPLLLPGIVP
jgi:N-acetylglucosamine-6-sulfatase